MTSHTLENDWVLKSGRAGALILRYLLLAVAILAAIISVLMLIAGIASALSPALAERIGEQDLQYREVLGVSAILAALAVGLWISARFFALLAQIVETVGEGDPFVAANADRLRSMGMISLWIFAISLVAGLAVFAYTRVFDETVEDLTIYASIESLFVAILLFILARVFRHGAAMREDLEGTV